MQNPHLRIERMLSENRNAEAFLKAEAIKGDKGDEGYTPQKYVDYFTPQEINAIIAHIQSQVRHGKDGEPGAQGEPGKDGDSPIRGIHYWTKADQEIIIRDILAKIPAPQKQITIEEVLAALPALSFKDIKDAPDVKDLKNLIAFLKAGGFRGGGDTVEAGTGVTITHANGVKVINASGISGTPIYGEDLTSQCPSTTFTLAHTPKIGTVRFYRGGARQSLANNDYSIIGDTITVSSTVVAAETPEADYVY